MTRTKLADRVLPVYTKGEEICNMVTHIIGAVLGVVAIVLCSIMAHSAYGVVSGIIFGVSMLVLYTMSSIYHGLSPNVKGKKVIQILDHCTIFILIAGSYTPFALCTLLGIAGFVLLLPGGIIYTIGAILYGIGKKKKYAHTVFHVCVFLGSLLHFFCILLYVI